MPKTSLEMAPDQGKTTIYVTWRDKRSEQPDVVPMNFDPTIKQVRYGFGIRETRSSSSRLIENPSAPQQAPRRWAARQGVQAAALRCADPNDVPEGATLCTKVPPKTASMQGDLAYVMARRRQRRTFNAPKLPGILRP
jgi:hypothetical protein